jgi:hypothetical protein
MDILVKLGGRIFRIVLFAASVSQREWEAASPQQFSEADFALDAFVFRLHAMLAKMKSGDLRTLFFEVLSVSATARLLASS